MANVDNMKKWIKLTENMAQPNDLSEPSSVQAVMDAISYRITQRHLDVISKYGISNVYDAILEVAEFVGDVEEIGTSDVSIWTKQVIEMLQRQESDNAVIGSEGA
jgi:hypothetical protein